jgi:hypothetical protein
VIGFEMNPQLGKDYRYRDAAAWAAKAGDRTVATLANIASGVVTLRCEEARRIAPYGFSSGRERFSVPKSPEGHCHGAHSLLVFGMRDSEGA